MSSPLHHAVNWCHYDAAKLLLDHGADVNACISLNHDTPLHLSASRSVEISELLIERGANISAKNIRGNMPLIIAVNRRLFDLIPILTSPDTINHKNKQATTVLGLAYQIGDVDIVNTLIGLGANNHGYVSSRTFDAYMSRTLDGNAIREMVRTSIRENDITSAYILAVKMGIFMTTTEIQALIDRRANININIGLKEVTLLLYMCYKGDIDAVNLLIDNGAYIALEHIFYAIKNGHINIVRLLLPHIGDINWICYGSSLLHHASNNGHVDIVSLLIEKGANVNVRNNRNRTPIISSILAGYLDVVKLLIEAGTDLTVPDTYGITALQYAYWNGNKEIYELVSSS